jgi:hypothetical protein
MSELNQSEFLEEPIDGKIVGHDIADRTVAFFVALSDPKVDKDWSELGKTLMVVVPAVIAVAATRGKAKGGLRNLIGPGIALGKLVKDVNGQITPEHLNKAHNYVEQAKTTAAITLATAKAKAARRTNL